jgi:hypothetical protein
MNGSIDESVNRVAFGGTTMVEFQDDPRIRPCPAYRVLLENMSGKKWVRSGIIPILRNGNTEINNGAVTFTPSLAGMISFDASMRRRGQLIHFTDGSRCERGNCWVLCGRRIRSSKLILRYEIPIVPVNITQSALAREDNHDCPVCYGDMREAGILVTCPNNNHQVCRSCFRGICVAVGYGLPKCPTCRDPYTSADVTEHFRNQNPSVNRRVLGRIACYTGETDLDADALFISHFIDLMKEHGNSSADTMFFCDTLFHYGGVTHRPLLTLDPMLNVRTPVINEEDTILDALGEFITYLMSDANIERLKNVDIKIAEREYPEAEYFTDLVAEYGSETALAKIREGAGNEKLKNTSRRHMYLNKFKLISASRHRIAFNHALRRDFTRESIHESRFFEPEIRDIPYNALTIERFGEQR